MHFYFLVEEKSAEEALNNIVPKIIGEKASFDIISFQGKPDLLKNLTNRLKGYRDRLKNCSLDELRLVVLIDKHTDDCRALKEELEEKARAAGFDGKVGSLDGKRFHILNRIVVEELEAWFFGDVEALHAVYPRIPPYLDKKEKYRDADAIAHASKMLAAVLKKAGQNPQGKREVSRMISPHMLPDRNRSKSFQVFRDGLVVMLGSQHP